MVNWTLKLPAVFFAISLVLSVGFAAEAASSANWLALADAIALPATTEPPAPTEPSEQMTEQKPWDVTFKVYTWIPSYHGTAGRGGNTSTVDVTCSDIFHILDEVNCMVPINLEARLGRWGMIVDLFYIRVEDSSRQGPITIDSRSTQTVLELAAYYRVGTWPVCSERTSSLTLDILGGARYNRLSGGIGLQAGGRSVSIGGAQEWWDPFVGPRLIWRATAKFSLSARADVGGFGIGNCSHFAWQAIAAAEYDLTEHCFIEAGYRLLDTDYQRGGGSTRFVYDVTMHGPYLAFGVRF